MGLYITAVIATDVNEICDIVLGDDCDADIDYELKTIFIMTIVAGIIKLNKQQQ